MQVGEKHPEMLIHAMAFMSTGGILKNIQPQGEILWKLSFLQRLRVTLPTESVVSSSTALGINCLCTGQCWHGVAMYLADPNLAFLTRLPSWTSDLPCHQRFVWWSENTWPDLLFCLTGVPWDCGLLVMMLPTLPGCHPQLLAHCPLRSCQPSLLPDTEDKFDSVFLLSFSFLYSLN